jgi:glycopeptide antibiotics resistance protein
MFTTPRIATAARVLLPVYLAVVAYIVFSPSDETTQMPGLVGWVFDRIDEMRETFEPAYIALEFGANVAMFVPFGVLVWLAFGRPRWWIVLLLGFATTVTIELVQLTLPTRFSTVSDVVANTLGTAIGLAIVHAVAARAAPRGDRAGQM